MKTKYIIILLILLVERNIFSQRLSIQTGHSAGITDLVFSKDGKYLFSSGEDSKVILWDMISSRQVNIFSGHTRTVNSLALHPTKNLIASASDDNSVKIWEFPSGKLVKEYNFFEYPVKSVAFHPNGEELACGSDSVYLIDLKTGNFRKIGKFAKKGYNAIDYSADGKYLAFGGKKTRKVSIYYLDNEKVVKKAGIKSNDLLFDDERKAFYAAGQRGNIKYIPVQGGGRRFNISNDITWNSYFALVTNQDYFIAANRDGLIYLYDRKSGARKEILKAHSDEVNALALEPKGRFLASAGKDRKIYIWDLQKLELVKSMEGGANRINSISFSDNGKLMFIAYNDGSFRIWNLDQKGKVLFQKENKLTAMEQYQRYKYATDGSNEKINTSTIFVKASLNQKDKYSDEFNTREALIIWKLREGMKTITLKSKKSTEYQSFLIKDTTTILFFKSKGTHSQKYSVLDKQKLKEREEIFKTAVYTVDLANVKKDKKLKAKGKGSKKLFTVQGDLYFKALSPSGSELLALLYTKSGQTECQHWNLDNNELIGTYTLENQYHSGGFSSNGKYIYLINDKSQAIELFNPDDMQKVYEFTGIAPVSFSDDDKLIAFTDEERNLILLDIKTSKKIFKTPTAHSSTISSIKFNKDYGYIATAAHDGLIRFWDFNSGNSLVSLAAFGEDDFIYINPDNYYYSTKGAMDYIAFIENDKLYTFEQFDVQFNRPDLVFANLKYSNPEEIAAYNKAYTKRVQKMGFAKMGADEKINIPEIKILNLDDFPISIPNDEINIKLNARDSLHQIDRINVWVNDVPVAGTNGIAVLSKKQKSVTIDCPVKLSAGKNKIQVSCSNDNGFESLKETFSIIFDTKQHKPDLYLVTIGVSKYQNPTFNLEYAAKDAEDVKNLFAKGKNKVYDKVHTITVLNNEATVSNILKLKSQLESTHVDDVVVLFFAGHGVLDNDLNYYLATTEIDLENMSNTALRYDYLEGLFDGIPARKKVIIIDACHSGEVDKEEEFTEVETEDDNMFVVTRDVRSAAALETRSKITTQNSFELMKMMFADIRKGTGSTVISSAGGGEYAYETGEAKNGVFTFVMKNGIHLKKADLNHDGEIMVSELRDYVSKTVSKLTKGSQNPTYRRENLEFDFRIW
ncbi:MAG: caspase family protein [Bacteroidales bacterium]